MTARRASYLAHHTSDAIDQRTSIMRPRIKKLIGIFILLPYFIAYAFAAAALGEQVPDFWLLKLLYFMVAGIVWVFPVKYLMMWMNAEPQNRQG